MIMINLDELRRAAEAEDADDITLSPEEALWIIERLQKTEALIAAVRELTFTIRPRYLAAFIRERLDGDA